MDIDEVESNLEINKTDWHDGRLRGLEWKVSVDVCSVTMFVEIYADEQSAERHAIAVKFNRVSEFMQTGIMAELQSHYEPGNIVQARFNVGEAERLDFSVHLTGGYIRIAAEEVTVIN